MKAYRHQRLPGSLGAVLRPGTRRGYGSSWLGHAASLTLRRGATLSSGLLGRGVGGRDQPLDCVGVALAALACRSQFVSLRGDSVTLAPRVRHSPRPLESLPKHAQVFIRSFCSEEWTQIPGSTTFAPFWTFPLEGGRGPCGKTRRLPHAIFGPVRLHTGQAQRRNVIMQASILAVLGATPLAPPWCGYRLPHSPCGQ